MGVKVLCKKRRKKIARLLTLKRNQGISEMLVGTNYYCKLTCFSVCTSILYWHQVPTEVLCFRLSSYDADISVIEGRRRMCFDG